MVTNNKVLTVSYGTFSCTLEGFDDSFGAMKAIAEYFRDLAADDRYFGAEPPTPDAEMLARIAEREIERRVRARTEDGAIYLSTATQDQAEAAKAPEADVEPAEMPAELSAPVAEVEEPQVAPVTEDISAPTAAEPVIEPEPELEAAPEMAVAAEPQEAPVIEDLSDQGSEAVETEVEPIAEDIADVSEAPEVLDTAAEIEAPMPDPEPEDVELLEPEESLAPEADSIAAKLERIRAVVSKSTQEPDEDSYSEDEHAQSFLANTRREIENVLQLDDEMAAAAVAEDVEEEEFAAADDEEAPVAPTRARILRMKKADFQAAVADGLLEAEPDEDTAEAEPAPETDTQPTSLSPEDEAELLAELAQVEAELNRADAETPVPQMADAPIPSEAGTSSRTAGFATASGEEMSRLLNVTNTQLDEPEGSRRRRAIAHLRAAVAATKAEQGASLHKGADDTEAYREDLASVVRPVKPVSQSMSQPARQPEGRTEQPRPTKPAPLKLVAEQRVDTRAEAPTPAVETPRAPVRPRRVSAVERREASATPPPAPTDAAAGASSFADYAESVGAVELPDLLEAAAAYLTFVEGHEKFSRPMVMRMARDFDEDKFSREDSLRSFGQLLRQNKIAKLKGGRFTASEEISYKPKSRAAG